MMLLIVLIGSKKMLFSSIGICSILRIFLMQTKVNYACFLGVVMVALITETSAEALVSNALKSEFSQGSLLPELLESSSTNSSISLPSQPVTQVAAGNITTSLNRYIEENQNYFDTFALRESNKIGSGNAIWEEASLNFDESNGEITLDLDGTVLLPFPASLVYSNPDMQLKLSFTPNECFKYSYSGHTLEVESNLEAIIRSEVSALLENSARDIEASLNNEVTQSLITLQLQDDLGC
ncbi:MAG: hypothetical protein AAFW84_34040 [Cyanobacteria bacterium J06635_15]